MDGRAVVAGAAVGGALGLVLFGTRGLPAGAFLGAAAGWAVGREQDPA